MATSRGTTLTVFAVLFAVLAISNLLKPLQISAETGFVLFGRRLSGGANAVAGPLFGLLLAAYAYGIWNMRRWALPLSYVYATYVVLNLLLFMIRAPRREGIGYLIFGLVYMAVAIGVSAGAAVLLTQRKAELA
jgi:hypothetical protein